jgi:serine/threonine protein kinase
MTYGRTSSLEKIYRKTGPIPVDIVGKITYNVLSGLIYLYDSHRIIHRGKKRYGKGNHMNRGLINDTQISNHATSCSTPQAKSRFAILA